MVLFLSSVRRLAPSPPLLLLDVLPARRDDPCTAEFLLGIIIPRGRREPELAEEHRRRARLAGLALCVDGVDERSDEVVVDVGGGERLRPLLLADRLVARQSVAVVVVLRSRRAPEGVGERRPRELGLEGGVESVVVGGVIVGVVIVEVVVRVGAVELDEPILGEVGAEPEAGEHDVGVETHPALRVVVARIVVVVVVDEGVDGLDDVVGVAERAAQVRRQGFLELLGVDLVVVLDLGVFGVVDDRLVLVALEGRLERGADARVLEARELEARPQLEAELRTRRLASSRSEARGASRRARAEERAERPERRGAQLGVERSREARARRDPLHHGGAGVSGERRECFASAGRQNKAAARRRR
mmetsp:Transcript_15382/g.61890  ORF Transcript_15382/g.61890 Transcript_15382/m.61890 type:complete len:360 (+) Transcript_15382:1381-2460(+)